MYILRLIDRNKGKCGKLNDSQRKILHGDGARPGTSHMQSERSTTDRATCPPNFEMSLYVLTFSTEF